MPTVTSLVTQQNDAERVSIFLDGAFAFGASRIVVSAHRVVEGRELTDEEIADLRADESIEHALSAALHVLSFRPRSRRELEAYMLRKGVDNETARAVVERLQRSGLLNDREFAKFWVENRQVFRPRGARALQAELRQKGLDREIIDEVLDSLGDEQEAAYAAGRRKAHSLLTANEREFLRKMVAFLQRRGFPYAVSSSVAARLYQEATGNASELDNSEW